MTEQVEFDWVHIIPEDDFFEHEATLLCVCGVHEQPSPVYEDATIVVHTPWDGRNVKRKGATPETCGDPDCPFCNPDEDDEDDEEFIPW